MLVTINGGERPRAAAFGSDRRPFLLLESSNGLRPLPSASFNERACSRPTRKKRSRLPALGLPLKFAFIIKLAKTRKDLRDIFIVQINIVSTS